ncbi:hypothetical protein [Dyadobacter sp. OTU695]|uniref:hypothetical protein n=1 Tax=Dyadobacter sp. OTU695 TaxID=3043860 RepID=UPI00313BF3C0
MIQQVKSNAFFDVGFSESEQLPRVFNVTFEEVGHGDRGEVRVSFNGSRQLGNVISDNSYENDFYRYHDIFHYSFATLLGWSPCARAMIKCKRKSDSRIDEIEDGARAAITEEALSMIIFNEAKRRNYFRGASRVSETTLRIINEMTENFEVRVRSSSDWEFAILKSYEIFRDLIDNRGGRVYFDLIGRQIRFEKM